MKKNGSALAHGEQWEEAESEFLINLKTARQIADLIESLLAELDRLLG